MGWLIHHAIQGAASHEAEERKSQRQLAGCVRPRRAPLANATAGAIHIVA